MVVNRKLSRELFLINGSLVFYVFLYKYGDNYLEVEIKKLIGMVYMMYMYYYYLKYRKDFVYDLIG